MHESGDLPAVKMRTYTVNEIFLSLQGEGVRGGTANVFVRFTGCNLRCEEKAGARSPGGFDCDTEFTSGRPLTLEEIHTWVRRESKDCRWLILTGGEPGLQVDQEFCDYFHGLGYKLAVETNGTVNVSSLRGLDRDYSGIDWITVSPKVAEHCIKQKVADEVKYVRAYGQGIPRTVVESEHYLISPAFRGNEVDRDALEWCIKLCLENPQWRLSVQQHKHWKVR